MLSCSLSRDRARKERYLEKSEMYLIPEIFVYNKKKIQMIFVEYGFNFTREVKHIYISFVASPLMKYKYFALNSMK